MPRSSRKRLPSALRRAVEAELPKRDAYQTAVFRTLVNSERLPCEVICRHLAVLHAPNALSDREPLVAGVLYPVWRGDWRHISTDEHVYDEIWYYFHAITTYILRSRLLNCTGAIALSFGKACDFRYGSRMWEARVGLDVRGTATFGDVVAKAIQEWEMSSNPCPPTSPRRHQFLNWIPLINALDPYVHRMLYQYVRAVGLREADFLEDAVTALDSAVDVAAQFVRDRLRRDASKPGAELIAAFDLGREIDNTLGHLHALRNYFGAHPGESGWWDFRDNYSEGVHSMFDAVRYVVWRICRAETRHRSVEPHPEVWSDWFVRYATVISQPVWFRFDGPSWKPLSLL